MKLTNVFENNRQPVYHACTVKNALDILTSGTLEARTEQTIKGKVVKGVSTTRDMQFALKWNPITFELEANTIKYNHKMVPVDFLIHKPNHNVKPRDNSEEFIIGNLENLGKHLKRVMLDKRASQSGYYDDLLDILDDKYHHVEVVYKS